MFGQSYSYQKQPKILSDGDYDVTLGKPFETKIGDYSALRFPFTVDGETEPVIPNCFDLFDVTDPTNQVNVEIFNKAASKIKACFKLKGSFTESNYIGWEGHKGKIRIAKSKNGFTNVTQFYKAEFTPGEEAFL